MKHCSVIIITAMFLMIKKYTNTGKHSSSITYQIDFVR